MDYFIHLTWHLHNFTLEAEIAAWEAEWAAWEAEMEADWAAMKDRASNAGYPKVRLSLMTFASASQFHVNLPWVNARLA